MPSFGRTSLNRLSTCDLKLQRIAHELIKEFDFTVCCGHRTEIEQNQAVCDGKSFLKYPRSKHNKYPSRAMDIAPYNVKTKGLDFSDAKMNDMLNRVQKIADQLGIKIRLGRDFKSLGDANHVELI